MSPRAGRSCDNTGTRNRSNVQHRDIDERMRNIGHWTVERLVRLRLYSIRVVGVYGNVSKFAGHNLGYTSYWHDRRPRNLQHSMVLMSLLSAVKTPMV